MKYAGIAAGVAALGVLVACVQATTMPEAADGRRLYVENCAQCHGSAGQGDGPWAKEMTPTPPALTQLMEGGTFPRARVLSTIDGYHRAQIPGQQMPEFGALLTGETVPLDTGDGVMTPTPRPLAALLSYLESIQEG
ncbi:cytochrome c [Roseovarius sp. Pro17]|uniref:c-type cytochrome n=1 Tax=Roseovarius sp. Pro17 TaxID=3108175 RepID=UPI002D79D14C|nr:cytochrome c [Roseovarius sp. Pro17]